MAASFIETFNLERFQDALEGARTELRKSEVIERIWQKDHTVWKSGDAEISNRLGWLESPRIMVEAASSIKRFVEDVRKDGYTHALLLGMGGSSLAPELFSEVFGAAKGYLQLHVLDSTDPETILEVSRALPIETTLFIVSSKSGTTLETSSFLNYFYALVSESLGKERAGVHFAAITDPGTPLEKIGRALGFRKVIPGLPDIGGRYSVISPFGLVPAALLGLDMSRLLEPALQATRLCRESDPGRNPGASLGVLLGVLGSAGNDKATFLISPRLESLGGWIEQLLAESTGKEGRGILPIVNEHEFLPEKLAPDRTYLAVQLADDRTYEPVINLLKQSGRPLVLMTLNDLYDLGGQFFIWEIAVAVAGRILKINPFDQPDVAASKKKTEVLLNIYKDSGCLPQDVPSFEDPDIRFYADAPAQNLAAGLDRFLGEARPGDYIAVQAFLPVKPDIEAALQKITARLRSKTRLAVTYGFGPRYLHSTGQLHKGGGGNGLFIQLTAEGQVDVPIPESPGGPSSSYSFAILKQAQARGDWEALREKDRRIVRVSIKSDLIQGLKKIAPSPATLF